MHVENHKTFIFVKLSQFQIIENKSINYYWFFLITNLTFFNLKCFITLIILRRAWFYICSIQVCILIMIRITTFKFVKYIPIKYNK